MNRRNFLLAATGCAVAVPVNHWAISISRHKVAEGVVQTIRATRFLDKEVRGFCFLISSDSLKNERNARMARKALQFSIEVADSRLP